MTKIAAVVRSLNEQDNIGPWIRAYVTAGVDWVLVADGGSTDRTLEVARGFEMLGFASVRSFRSRVQGEGGGWRNPEGEHVNFLLDWAGALGAEWVIFDDCDCRPNFRLRRVIRPIIAAANAQGAQVVKVVRLYLWGEDQHFPNLAKPNPETRAWEPSLWAWRLDGGPRASESEPWMLSYEGGLDGYVSRDYLPPICLLHRPWPSQEVLKRKMAFYAASGGHVALDDPRDWGGPIEPLPEWAHE